MHILFCPANCRSKILRIVSLLCLVSFLLSISPVTVFSAEKIELTLSEAIALAVRQNLVLEEERLNPKIAEADIMFKEGDFDPALELKTTESYKKYLPPTTIIGTEERTYNADMGIGGKINTGTTYELKWTNERGKSNSPYYRTNPYYFSELVLAFTQPVLKGFGKEVQESELNIAKNNLEISKLALDDKTITIISETTKAYWDLVFARHELEVAEFSVKLAKKLLAEINAKIKLGLMASMEIYKAEAEVSLREEALLKAKKAVMDAADKLSAAMNIKDWDTELVPIEKTPQKYPDEIYPLNIALEEAFKYRKDYKQASIECKNKEILKKFYDNQRYPDINLTGSAGVNGLNETYNSALDRMNSKDYYTWQIGFSLKIPIGNRTASGKYNRARYDEEKSNIAFKTLEQKISTEVREAWRSLQLAVETIKASRKTKTAAEKRLEAEEGKFKIGMSTINDVLKFQEEYVKALSSEKKAEIDYAKASVEFEKVKGTLGSSPAKIFANNR